MMMMMMMTTTMTMMMTMTMTTMMMMMIPCISMGRKIYNHHNQYRKITTVPTIKRLLSLQLWIHKITHTYQKKNISPIRSIHTSITFKLRNLHKITVAFSKNFNSCSVSISLLGYRLYSKYKIKTTATKVSSIKQEWVHRIHVTYSKQA